MNVVRTRGALWGRVSGRVGNWMRGAAWKCRLREFGKGSRIDRPAFLVGGQGIRIASHVHIWRESRIEALNANPDEVRIHIGAGTCIQPGVHLGAVLRVEIGRGVLMASRVYITDHDHDWSDPDDPVILNGRLVAAPVTIGDYVWLGEGVMVLKGVHIGERSVVGAGSIVTRSIPPLSVAVGAPARVIRRFDRSLNQWVRV